MAINKVDLVDRNLIDLTQDDVTENDVLEGKTFHLPNGEIGKGKVVVADVIDNLESESATDALSANQGRVLNEKLTDVAYIQKRPLTEAEYQAIPDVTKTSGIDYYVESEEDDGLSAKNIPFNNTMSTEDAIKKNASDISNLNDTLENKLPNVEFYYLNMSAGVSVTVNQWSTIATINKKPKEESYTMLYDHTHKNAFPCMITTNGEVKIYSTASNGLFKGVLPLLV